MVVIRVFDGVSNNEMVVHLLLNYSLSFSSLQGKLAITVTDCVAQILDATVSET